MKIDDALRDASAAADRSTTRALPGEPPKPRDRRALLSVSVAALLVAGFGAAALLRSDETSVAATATDDAAPEARADADDDPPPEPPGQATGGGGADERVDGLPRFVSDAPPDGLSLDYAGPATGIGPVTGTEVRWIYGHPDRGPSADERAITVIALTGAQRPVGLLAGDDVEINGVDGRILPDGTVMFELGQAMVSVFGTVERDDLVEVAQSIGLSSSGQPVLPETIVGDYSLLGSFDGSFYGAGSGALASDAQVSTYRQGYVRYLDLVSTPRTNELDHMYRWLTPADAETVAVDGRTFTYLYSHESFGAPAVAVVWFDDTAIGTAISYGVDRDDVDEALAALRIDGDPPVDRRAPASEIAADEAPVAATSDQLADAVPTIVVDGMEIVAAVDHTRLGGPDWSAEQYVYGPDGVDVPGPADPVLVLTITDASDGLLIGEPVEIGGHDGVIVDKAEAGTDADLEFRVGDTTVQLTGRANVDLDMVVAAAEQYATWVFGAGGLTVGVPNQIGVDLTLRGSETIGAWFPADVNGALDATTIVYAEPGSTSETGGRRLSVSSNSKTSRSVDWLAWIHPASTSTVEIGDGAGLLAAPRDGVLVLRFESSGRVIEIIGAAMTEQEVLAAAEVFPTSTGNG